MLGTVLSERAAGGVSVTTPVLRLAAAVHYAPAHADARKRAMTLEDLLTMQSGLAWRESGYAYEPGSGNDVLAMSATKDWSGYVIDRPMAAQPGTTFNYNTGASHVVSGVVTVLTRRPAAAIATTQVFAPLGIRGASWLSDPDGVSAGGFGLLLKPRDLAKLAFLYLHQGRWDGRQIVPAAWVEQLTVTTLPTRRTSTGTCGGSTAPTATRTWPACTGNWPRSSRRRTSSSSSRRTCRRTWTRAP